MTTTTTAIATTITTTTTSTTTIATTTFITSPTINTATIVITATITTSTSTTTTTTIKSAAKDPCLQGNFMKLDNLLKRSPTYTQDSTPLCDRYITEGWYRARDHVMSTSAPLLGKCGTLYPVWLKDPVPETGQKETLTACQVGFSDNCTSSIEIEAKNCTSFLVYNIKALETCNSAYCFERDNSCVNTSVEIAQVSYHNITWNTKGNADAIRYDPYVNLVCSFTHGDDDTLLYHINWFVNNSTLIKSQTVDKTSSQNVILSAEDVHDAGKKIGIWILCTVGIKKSEDDLPCSSTSSNLFFAGIEILNPTLTIERQRKGTLTVRPTIPFAAETIEINGLQSSSSLSIQLSFPDKDTEDKCKASGHFTDCEIKIPSYKYNERQKYEDPVNWRKDYTMDIFNSDEEDYYLADHHLVLQLKTNRPNGNGAKIFSEAELSDVNVNVVESQEGWKGKRCSSYLDPHMTTFDGKSYECQSNGCLPGRTYILYRNDDHLQEVQVRHTSCWKYPRCICGVAARSGQDVFMIDFCDQKRTINFPICRDHSIKVIKESDKEYKITFPTGTFVKAKLYEFDSWYINVEIYPTVADFNRTSGLCGLLDDDKTNDFSRKDGLISHSNPPDDFSKSWSLNSGSIEDLLSTSETVYDNLTPLSTYFKKLCTCDDGKTKCSYKKYRECKTDVRGKEYHCILHSSSRKKRDLEYFSTVQRSEPQSDTVTKREARGKRQVISVSEAQDTCYKAFQQSSLYGTCLQVVPNFSNESVLNCISDLSVAGEENLTQTHLNIALSQCQAYIVLNSTLEKEQPTLSEIMINLCPNNCSNKGLCSGGNCTCDYGYGGSDCSFDVLAPPTITRISDGGVCDKTDEPCDDITLYGEYFLENMGTTCYLTRKEMTKTNITASEESYTVDLEERTLFEGYCRLEYSQTNTWSTTFQFKISNDGTQFSEIYSVYVYQSQCQIFNNDTGSVYFTLQDGYCYINGSCVQRGGLKNSDPCFQCDPDKDRYDWTHECTTSGSTSASITSTGSSISNQPKDNTRKNAKQETELSQNSIGLISACVIFTTGVIFLAGYLLKRKCQRRKEDRISSTLQNHDDVNSYPECDNGPRRETFHVANLFQVNNPYSRPPSAASMTVDQPTIDLQRIYKKNGHLDKLFSVAGNRDT
ncbi:von Willebrand factor D and EGF domain-containing protein-like [Ostrea edulis]|uniref:von Willebrand factor D and EGF domain-containing protein-like n=1 Tax=Ostrea edulis TaxID=37623 RepID=UPI0024AFE8A5|nr:von Willebrand factor D and EGF domain-containing protein-like [Ostrea edulis]